MSNDERILDKLDEIGSDVSDIKSALAYNKAKMEDFGRRLLQSEEGITQVTKRVQAAETGLSMLSLKQKALVALLGLGGGTLGSAAIEALQALIK